MSQAATRPQWKGLFAKYVVAFVGFAVFVLAAHSGLEMWFTYRETKAALLRTQFEKAEDAAGRISRAMPELERQISWATRASASTLAQRRSDYSLLLAQNAAVAELSYVDPSGREQLRVSRDAATVSSGRDLARDPRFAEATARGHWLSPPFFPPGAAPRVSMALAHSGANAGVTVADIELGFLVEILKTAQAGKASYSYVADGAGRLLARSDSGDVRNETNLSQLPQVASRSGSGQPGTVGADLEGRSVLAASAPVPGLDWSVFVERPLREAYGPLYDALARLAGLLAIVLVLAVVAGTLLARHMVVPIRIVQGGASRIGAGDLGYRIEVRTGDEIQTLAEEFNAMAARVEESHNRLEGRVEERTRELAQSVRELKALEEVGRAVTSSLDLNAVLAAVVSRAVELTRADAGAVYCYEPGKRHFTVLEPRGYPHDLVEHMRQIALEPEDRTMREAMASDQPVFVPDLAQGPPPSIHKAMAAAGFRSMLLVPLRGADAFFGFLAVHWRATQENLPRRLELMQTFAHQSALAIHNARLFTEVEEKGRELAIASEHKSQFFANMSHELRTPLNAVLGYAELLLDDLYGEIPAKAKEVLGRVQNNGTHLLGLINDVLDLSKIEAGQLTLALDTYAMRSVVDAVLATTEALAKAKGITVSATVPEALPLGRGDERRLMQVLLNIVSNAVKFTDAGAVTIAVGVADGLFEITVRDTGPGISPQDQARVFEAFQQADVSNTRQKGGTGLGLSIARRLVALHGGTISLHSEIGVGSTFTIVLPIHADAQKVAA